MAKRHAVPQSQACTIADLTRDLASAGWLGAISWIDVSMDRTQVYMQLRHQTGPHAVEPVVAVSVILSNIFAVCQYLSITSEVLVIQAAPGGPHLVAQLTPGRQGQARQDDILRAVCELFYKELETDVPTAAPSMGLPCSIDEAPR